MSLSPFLKTLHANQDLSQADMRAAMSMIMEGQINDTQLIDFLTTLAQKGETATEITGAASIMREKALEINAPSHAIDCCGTGGDASGTYNISSTVAIIAAACGIPIAKHGNRSASSKSGAADVLEALGMNLNASTEILENSLRHYNYAFLMAPKHHGAMKHVASARKAIGKRTIFNLLGPLANPAKTQRQLIGVFSPKWITPIAETLHNLGTEKAWVVHGHFSPQGGLDEISTTGATQIAILEHGAITKRTLIPDDFGLPTTQPEELIGGDAQHNAQALRALLEGKPSAYRDITLANTSAVLNIADKADTLKQGVDIAAKAIDNGDALKTLNAVIKYTQEPS